MSDHEIEQLYSNERLTDNLPDPLAQALLKWGEDQLQAGVAAAQVHQALRKANRSDLHDPEALLQTAQAALAAVPTPAPESGRMPRPTQQSYRWARTIQHAPRRRVRIIFKLARNHGPQNGS